MLACGETRWDTWRMDDWDRSAEMNRRAWDEIAGPRHAWRLAQGYDAGFLARGGVCLPDPVRDALGNVAGKSLLHLQCATGEETLSWAVLGAQVTAVDISELQIGIAHRTAADAGVEVEFVTADVGELPSVLNGRTFHVVYTATGVLTWIPDLWRWARIVASLVTTEGRFMLFEEHPVASCLWGGEDGIEVADYYFARGRPLPGIGWSHFPGGDDAREEKVEFHWPLGDVVTALVDSGLRIVRLEEFPAAPEWRFGPQRARVAQLPGLFLLVASR